MDERREEEGAEKKKGEMMKEHLLVEST